MRLETHKIPKPQAANLFLIAIASFLFFFSTNTLITKYSKHLWSYEQKHTHKDIKSLPNSEKKHKDK